MNLQSLVVVILRLMSFSFFLQAAVQVSPQIFRAAESYRRLGESAGNSLFVLPALLVIGLIISAVLIWVFALPIARLVTRGVPQDLSFGVLSLVDCYSIAFIGIGLFYITSHLPQVLNWTHYFLTAPVHNQGARVERTPWYDITQDFIPFIVGVAFFVNGRKWAVGLARRNTGSAQPVASDANIDPPATAP